MDTPAAGYNDVVFTTRGLAIIYGMGVGLDSVAAARDPDTFTDALVAQVFYDGETLPASELLLRLNAERDALDGTIRLLTAPSADEEAAVLAVAGKVSDDDEE